MTQELTQFGPGNEGRAARSERLKREVGGDIVAAAYLRGSFTLPSGETSDYYFDKYLFETKPTILRRVAEMIADLLPSSGIDRLAGAGGGGVALAAAVSLETGLPFVILHPGTDHPLRGELHGGERIFVLADVVDSGSHVLRTLDVVTEAGGTAVGVISVIDRDAGGRAAISAAGVHYQPLYGLRDLGLGADTPVRVNPADLRAALSGKPIPSGGGDPFLDPSGVEQIGADLAALVGDETPDRVMVWAYSDAVLLAHVVARELGVTIVRGVEGAGVIDVEGRLGEGERVIILDAGDPVTLRQMVALARGRGAEPVAVLAITPTGATHIEGIPIVSLEGD